MKFATEQRLSAIKAKKKVPVTRITTEMRSAKEFRDILKFYVPKSTYTDDSALFNYGNSPVSIGYAIEDEKVRFICLSNKETYGITQQIKTPINLFEEKVLSADEIIKHINSFYDLYGTLGDQDEKIIRAIAWLIYVLKRDYKIKYEREDSGISHSVVVSEDERESLITDMIAAVDMKRFMQLLSIAGSYETDRKFANKEVAETILRNWAEAKVGFYKLFGKKLWVEKEVDVKITSTEMDSLRNELKTKYPKYSFAIHQTSISDWMNNTMGETYNHYDCWRDIPGVTKGMKLSKAFSTVYGDTDFDMSLSECLQNRNVKGLLRISIDPYDYLTQSVNKHGWNSCHRITSGEYATGPMSYMCDNVSLVAYRTNKTDYSYEFFGFKFVGNSKAWRANVVYDLNTCSFAIGRQYPNNSEEVETEAKDLLSHISKEYNPKISYAYIVDHFDGMIKDNNTLHYNDFLRYGGDKYMLIPSDTRETPSFNVGSPVLCVYCGKPISRAGCTNSHSGCLR